MPQLSLPANAYTDPGAFARERELIFGRAWSCAALGAQIPSPGDAIAATVAGAPLVVVRQPDGGVRAFYNACRHRAGPLVWDGEVQRGGVLRCRYHGWTYGTDGRLLGTAAMGCPVDVGGLVEVPAGVWRGLVFVCLGEPERPLADALVGLDAKVAVDWSGWAPAQRASHTLRCNWKVYVENYLEGWHIPYLHRDLAADVDLRTYRVVAGDGFATHHVAARDGAVSDGLWAWIWPNTSINVYKDGMSLERIVPVDADQTRLEYTYAFAAGVSEADRAAAVAQSTQLTHEDARVVEAVHTNLRAGGYDAGPLSPVHEEALAAFQGWVRAAVG